MTDCAFCDSPANTRSESGILVCDDHIHIPD